MEFILSVAFSGGFAIVIVEKAAQARSSINSAVASSHIVFCNNNAATQSLMVSLCMVMLHILPDRETKMFLSKRNDLVQTLGLDR